MMLIAMPLMVLVYSAVSALPSDSIDHLSIPLQGSFCLATVALVAWVASIFYVGIPETPIVLPKDEEEMALAFGCTSFEEVARVTGVADREEVVRRLSSSSPKGFKDLVERMDLSRLEGASVGATPTGASVPESPAALPVAASKEAPEPDDTDDESSDTTLPKSATQAPPSQVAHGHADKDTVVVEECSSVPAEPAALAPLAGEVTFCAVSCHSGSPGKGDVRSTRYSCSGSSLGALFGCCAADPRLQYSDSRLSGARVPLLQKQQVVQPGLDFKKEARELNEKILEMLRSKDKDGILRVYETVDPQLLYDAYLDMYDMYDKPALDQFEEDFDELVPEDEIMKVPLKRPELRVVFAKMLAHRMKKATFG